MHGMTGKPPQAATDSVAASRVVLFLLIVTTGLPSISLYLLLPALPKLAVSFGRDASVVQMTVSFYMAGIACSQLVMGPLSDKFGRRPIMLIGMGLAVIASLGCILAQTLPLLIAARFFQALGAATGIVVSRAMIRDLYPRDRIGAMISLITGVMMVAQMLSPLTGGLIDAALGWHAIFYIAFILAVAITVAVALALPETRIVATAKSGGFRGDVRDLITSRAFIGYVLCQVLASQIVFVFAGGGPYVVETLMGRSAAEYGFWFGTTAFAYLTGNIFCVRFSARHSLEKLIWIGLTLQFVGSLLNVGWSLAGLGQTPAWLFITQMLVMFANASVIANSAAGAISVRPSAAGTAAGAMGFLQMGLGAFVSQLGAWLGGHFTTTLPLTAAIFLMSVACACSMIFLVPRRTVIVSDELIEQAEEEETGMV